MARRRTRTSFTAGLTAGLSALGVAALTALVATPAQAAGYAPGDPTTWSNSQLAGQLTHSCIDATNITAMRAHSAAGIGGITLLGNNASTSLGSQLAGVASVAPAGVRPFIAGDEEGGRVQRLARVIYPLPSAKEMGTWPDAQIEDTAFRYGQLMVALGVLMDLGPVADLAVAGSYIDTLGRAFSADPNRVTAATSAWARGMTRAGVTPVIKHWPGHGSATDSHTNAAPTVPSLPTLEARDMVPFNAAFAAGAPVVMVGHLQSAGLTEPGLPATLSPNALRYLRARTGPNTVIVTDSLSMAGSSSGLGLTPEQAAVRALQAGADWALTCVANPLPTVNAIRTALDTGALSREAALASARRILALKARAGLVDGPLGAETPGSDLFVVLPNKTGSGQLEMHGLSRKSGYQDFSVHAATAFGAQDPAQWHFAVGSFGRSGRPDLIGVKYAGTGSGMVEVHVLTAASGYTQFALHAATALPVVDGRRFQFATGPSDGDGRSNLYAIFMNGTGSGRTEVHVLSEASNYTQWLSQSATARGETSSANWTFLVGDAAGRGDLVGVLRTGTGSGRTEVHTLTRVSSYTAYSQHTATALHETPGPGWSFTLGEFDRDGKPDLIGVVSADTGSGRTEAHILSGSSGFSAFGEHIATGLGLMPSSARFESL